MARVVRRSRLLELGDITNLTAIWGAVIANKRQADG
jgi:hypothetical protein